MNLIFGILIIIIILLIIFMICYNYNYENNYKNNFNNCGSCGYCYYQIGHNAGCINNYCCGSVGCLVVNSCV